jgi:hypothetical protein
MAATGQRDLRFRSVARRRLVLPQSQYLAHWQPRRAEADGSARDLVFGFGNRGWQDWSGSKTDLDARIAAAGKAFDWTLHDFRRSLSTALHERFGMLPHIVEATLGHFKAGVASVYNKALYLDERRRR